MFDFFRRKKDKDKKTKDENLRSSEDFYKEDEKEQKEDLNFIFCSIILLYFWGK